MVRQSFFDLDRGRIHNTKALVHQQYEGFCIKVTAGFEPAIRELQSHALPLGYVTRALTLRTRNPSNEKSPKGNLPELGSNQQPFG